MKKTILSALVLLTLAVLGLGHGEVSAGYRLNVVVKNSAGDHVSGATVAVNGPLSEAESDQSRQTLKTDADGMAQASMPRPGKYHVEVSHPQLGSSNANVDLTSDKFALTLETKLRSGKSKLKIHVRDQSGPDIADVAVKVKRHDQDEVNEYKSDANGSVVAEVGTPQPGGAGSTVFDISADHPDYEHSERVVQVERGVNKDYDVTLDLRKI